MRRILFFLTFASLTFAAGKEPEPGPTTDEQMLQKIYAETLSHGQAYANLRTLVAESPGRLSGSASLERAVGWGEKTLESLGLDRVFLQEVRVPHWERGPKESVDLLASSAVEPLSAVALGGSISTPKEGLTADVVEVKSLEELATLGEAKLKGKIVFFNRPMDPATVNPGAAYGQAGDQRNRGPSAAAKFGAAGALVRSLTHAHDDVPHTGNSAYLPGGPNIPAAALSTMAADKLSAALAGGAVRVTMKINSQWFPDSPSHNVVGEIKGSEFPDQILLVGGHLDSWDIAPGAHDDGAGIVQSIEVLRTLKALGIKPRHTVRCVLFVNEENGGRGAAAYAQSARTSGEKHLLAMESDNGGFQPNGFRFDSTQGGNAAERAARWRVLFEPYGITQFKKGSGGSDVQPLHLLGVTVGELTPDSQRYFDLHHTTIDSIDKVNPRELQLGAAALAALVWLVDTQGL